MRRSRHRFYTPGLLALAATMLAPLALSAPTAAVSNDAVSTAAASTAAVSTAAASTAAATDFVLRGDMTEAQQEQLPWFCKGGYVQPEAYRNATAPDETTPIHVSAKNLEHIVDQSSSFEGDVIADQDTRRLTGETLKFYPETETFELEGPMSLREPNLLVKGSAARGNLFEGSGVIDSATFLMHQSSMRGRASEIHQLANKDVVFVNGTITRCDPGENQWTIRSKKIHMKTSEGYGVARNMTLRVKNLPVVYLPYLRFPIDDKRHSGFLVPSGGHDNSGGTDISVPYYFNIAPNYDATYTARSLWKRGVVHDAEGRFITTTTSNQINAAFLPSDDVYDRRRQIDGTTNVATEPFQEEDRWLLNVRHTGQWRNFSTEVAFPAVSDIDYLSDIGGNLDSAANLAVNNVRENLNNNTRIPALWRWGEVSYSQSGWLAEMIVEDFQLMDARASEQHHRLPQVNISKPYSVGWIDTYNTLQYSFFEIENESLAGLEGTRGERTLLDFTAEVPFRSTWGFAIPSVHLLHREYSLRDQPATSRVTPEITTPSFSLDAGLYFDRFFTMAGKDFQHTLEPRVYYLYSDFDPQSDLPGFDTSNPVPTYSQLFRKNRFIGYDRLADANQLSVGIGTSLISSDTGKSLVSFAIGQSYYFKEREVVYRTASNEDPTAPASPLFTDVTLAVNDELSLRSTLDWEPSDGDTNSSTVSLRYGDGERKIVNFSYLYTAPHVLVNTLPGDISNQQESELSFIWPLSKKWSTIGLWNYSLDDRVTIESLAGIEYNSCCWKFRLAYQRYLQEPLVVDILQPDPTSPTGTSITTIEQGRTESRVLFEIQFKGIGQVSKRLDQLLEEAIPGYRNRENLIGQ